MSSRAPWTVASGWNGWSPAKPGQPARPLVDLRVVLHGAAAERIEPAVHAEVGAREALVVSCDVHLGDVRQRSGAVRSRPPSTASSDTSGTSSAGASTHRDSGAPRSKMSVR